MLRIGRRVATVEILQLRGMTEKVRRRISDMWERLMIMIVIDQSIQPNDNIFQRVARVVVTGFDQAIMICFMFFAWAARVRCPFLGKVLFECRDRVFRNGLILMRVVDKSATIFAFIIVVVGGGIDAIISYSLKSGQQALTEIQDTTSRESE